MTDFGHIYTTQKTAKAAEIFYFVPRQPMHDMSRSSTHAMTVDARELEERNDCSKIAHDALGPLASACLKLILLVGSMWLKHAAAAHG